MGQLYVVHRIDPLAIRRVHAAYQSSPDLDWAGAMQLFKELGRTTPPASGASSWEEYEEMFELERWNLVLLIAGSEASWDLDKSLDRPGDGLPGIASLAPELSPIRQLLTAIQSLRSLKLPEAFEPSEMGLMGVASPEVVKAAQPAATTFSKPEARARIAATPVPFLKKAFGGGATLSSWQADDYPWSHWCQLLTGVQEAASRDHAVGLEMR